MRSIFDMSGQQILTRALHVLTVLALLEKVALGMPKGYNFDRAPFSMGESFPAVAGQRMHNFHQLAHIVKRAASMSNTQSTYAMFYEALHKFSEEIPLHLKSDAPAVLSSNIGAVAYIITPSDSVFDDYDVEEISKRVMLTLAITEGYVKRLEDCHHVLDDSISWFESQKAALMFTTTLTKMSLSGLGLGEHDVKIGDAGIGGLNTGVSNSISPAVLGQVKDLIDGLSEDC